MSILHRVHGHAKRHYEKHYAARYASRAHLVFLLDAALVSCALGLLLLGSYFSWFYHPLRDAFKLNVTVAGEAVGGEETEIAVTMLNAGKRPLTKGHLSIRLPKAFLPEDGRGSVREFDVVSIAPNASIDYRVRGFLIGPPQSVPVIVRFAASDADGSVDEKLASSELRWERSLVTLGFSLPSAVVPGQDAAFRLHVKNGSPLPFAKASLKMVWPPGFRPLRSTPPIYKGAIALGDLSPGEEADAEFFGHFDGATDLLHFRSEMTGTFEGQPFLLAETGTDVPVVNAGLELDAAFTGSTPDYVKAGQEVPLTIRYRNDGSKEISRLRLSVKPDPSAISSVRWSEIPLVDALEPGASGTRIAYVRLRDAISPYGTDPLLRVIPQAEFDVQASALHDVRIDGKSVSTKIAGSARLLVAARYFTNQGDQIGRGPLPPRVGKTTTYWILASLETGPTKTENGTVIFTLPRGAAWTGRAAVSGGDDLESGGDRLVWRVGSVEPHAAASFEAPSASFEIALTPEIAQADTAPELLHEAAYTGTDAWTGIDLSSRAGSLDTRLTGDPKAAGRSKVVR